MAELHVGKMKGVAGVEKLVVIKRILPELAHRPDIVDMFVSEARVSALLQHPNIVQTYDVGKDESGYYIAMEYLEGSDLRKLMRQVFSEGKRFPTEFALQIVSGMLAGLHYAHERRGPDGTPLGIVHRDVSPHNTFITWDGAVKLLDFGVAKATNNLNDDDDFVQGKLRYMSPEQCLNATLDRRSDVYAAGVVLYELLTGTRAHRGKERTEIQASILDKPIPPPTAHGVKLDEELLAIVMRPLEKRRDARFQTAREFQRAIESYCQRRGIFPSPIRLGEWVRELLPTPQHNALNRTSSITRAPPPSRRLRSTQHAELRIVGGITVVHFRGRLDESFDGRTVGEQLEGPTLFDLDGVERITSFGIRSWLEMMRTARAKPLYFARVPEPFINQVSMVRGLLGKGSVCSFYVPFLCPYDHHELHPLLEGEEGKRFLTLGEIPAITCPRDPAHRPMLDEELDLFEVIAEAYVTSPPKRIRSLLRRLDDDRDVPPIEKVLDGDTTVIHIRRSLDGSPRWRRILDGLEGAVVLDLSETTSVTEDGVKRLASALAPAAPDLQRITVRAGRRELWEALHERPALRPLLELRSLVVPVRCPAVGCSEHGLVREIEVATEGDPPFELAPCRSCLGPVEQVERTLEGLPGFAAPPPKQSAPSERPQQQQVGCGPGCLLGIFGGLFG